MPRRRKRNLPGSRGASGARAPKRRRKESPSPLLSIDAHLIGGLGRRLKFTEEEFWEKIRNLHAKTQKNSQVLKVKSVNFHKVDNCQAHHTDEYEQNQLIIRRGQPHKLSITFDRNIKRDTDIIILQFIFGNKPQESKQTIIRFVVQDKKSGAGAPSLSGWSIAHPQIRGNTLDVEVNSSANSIVGKYGFFVETQLQDTDKDQLERYKHKEPFYVLFNPWCKEDEVYMEDEFERAEYVLNEQGKIWVGNEYNFTGRPWDFGQFDEPCLDAALWFLAKAEMPDNVHRSSVKVIRCISAMANSNDGDNGALTGRWSSTYPESCTRPTDWTGSVDILEQFMKTKKPVEFGQCWVFSGLVTTLLRALGIPTRSVTNFQSAHDCDCSMTIDRHMDSDFQSISGMDDSIWNFHVWNESWLRRSDLPDGYDGWQAHDATPQEASESVKRCGPAPLTAIKKGEVYLSYDIGFVFAEVNGDVAYWMVDEEGEMRILSTETKKVGKFISTKAVGSDDREDITHLYKYPDGSEEEKKVLWFVNKFSSRSNYNIYKNQKENMKKDVTFSASVPDAPNFGKPLDIDICMTSKSKESRHVKATVNICNIHYTNVPGHGIKTESKTIEVAAGKTNHFKVSVLPSEYEKDMHPEASIFVSIVCQVKETSQSFVKQEPINFVLPDLLIQVQGTTLKQNKNAKITAKVKNPLKKTLTRCQLRLSGVTRKVYKIEDIKPGEEITKEFTIKPRRKGIRNISCGFSSAELTGYYAKVVVEVQ